MVTVRQLVTQTFFLPPFQRDPEWPAEKQVAFCRTLWEGLPCAPLLIWSRHYKEGAQELIPGQKEGKTSGYRSYVIDGQQRLMAMGCRVLRADGTENPTSSAYLDLETGEWGVEPGPGRYTLAQAMQREEGYYDAMRNADEAVYRMYLYRAYVEQRVGGVSLVAYTLGHHGESNVEDVVEAFRSINQPGTPISPERIEDLLASAREPW